MRCSLRVNDKTYGEGISLDQYVIEVVAKEPWVTIKVYSRTGPVTRRIQLEVTIDSLAAYELAQALTIGENICVINERVNLG